MACTKTAALWRAANAPSCPLTLPKKNCNWRNQLRSLASANLLPRSLPNKMLSLVVSLTLSLQDLGADYSPPDSVDRPHVPHLSRLQRAGESEGLPRCRNGRRLCAIRGDDCGAFSTQFGAHSSQECPAASFRNTIDFMQHERAGPRGWTSP